MIWINFLHCYQPANSHEDFIKEATEKSYLRIIRALEENKDTKFTLNISGCLFLRWEELGFFDLIIRIANLVEQKKLELVSSVCYHPLMPLISENEIRKQIQENEEVLQRCIAKNFKAKGFFLPEMAYSPLAGKVIADFGYEWIILDEIAENGFLKNDYNAKVFLDKETGLKVVFRNRKMSSSFMPDTLNELIKNNKLDEFNNLITATDGELYGLRHIDHKGIFEKILKNEKIKTKTISEFVQGFDQELKEINLVSCNWESEEQELKNNLPFALWCNPENKIHLKLWDLANLCINTLSENEDDENFLWARWHLVRGLASCSFWWASEKDFSSIFGPLAWSPEDIEKGANDLVRSVRSLENKKTKKQKVKTELLFAEIIKLIWKKHWLFHWK